MQKRNNAGTAALLRGVVAAYLFWLGFRIITNRDTEMSRQTAWLTGGILLAAAAAFCGYTVYRWRADRRAAAEPPQDKGAGQ